MPSSWWQPWCLYLVCSSGQLPRLTVLASLFLVPFVTCTVESIGSCLTLSFWSPALVLCCSYSLLPFWLLWLIPWIELGGLSALHENPEVCVWGHPGCTSALLPASRKAQQRKQVQILGLGVGSSLLLCDLKLSSHCFLYFFNWMFCKQHLPVLNAVALYATLELCLQYLISNGTMTWIK